MTSAAGLHDPAALSRALGVPCGDGMQQGKQAVR